MPSGRYRPSSHQEDCCLPHWTHTTNESRQHQLFHHQPARLVCKQQQTAALERQPDRRARIRQNETGGDRVFAGWIWRWLALLASPYQTAHRGGPCENSDEEMGLSRRRSVGGLRLREPQPMARLLSCRLLDETCTYDDLPQWHIWQRYAPTSGEKWCEGHERRIITVMGTVTVSDR